MDTGIDRDATTGTWLDELECSDEGTHGTACLHRPGSAASGLVRDAASAIGLPGEKLPDLLVLRPRVPGTILPGVDLAAVQRPLATIFALLPDLPNLTHHAGGHLPDLFAFTDVLEGVITLDEGKFRAGTTALGESVVSIVRIPRNQARHFYELAYQAWEAREAARAAQHDQTDVGTDTDTDEEQETEQTTGSKTPETAAPSASSPAASATVTPTAEDGTKEESTARSTDETTTASRDEPTPHAPEPSGSSVPEESMVSAPEESAVEATPTPEPTATPPDAPESVAPAPEPESPADGQD